MVPVPILPSIVRADADSVKDQVQGLLQFAGALLDGKRQDAHHRVKRARRPQRDLKKRDREPALTRRPSYEDNDNSPKASSHLLSPKREASPSRSRSAESFQPSLLRGSSSSSHDENQDTVSPRKKAVAKLIPQLTPSPRASQLEAAATNAHDEGDPFFSVIDTEIVVEKYRQRSRAAEAAVQASVERFHRGRKQQEPLLDDLKQLKRAVASTDRKTITSLNMERRIELGIRQSWQSSNSKSLKGKNRAASAEGTESDASSSASGSASEATDLAVGPRQSTLNLTQKPVELMSSRSPNSSKASSLRRAQDLPFEEEEQLFGFAKEIEEREQAQSLRLQRSGELYSTFGDSSRDWLQDAHGARTLPTPPQEPIVFPEPRYRAKRAPRCLQPTEGKEALTPAELRSLPGTRGRQLPFWHSSAWSRSLRAVAHGDHAIHEVPRQHCIATDSQPHHHRFIVGDAKQDSAQVRTLRLEVASSGSSSFASSKGVQFNSKDRLAKSCLKPWRSPEDALIGKSFVFPSGRRGSRFSEHMASTHKGSKTVEKPTLSTEQVDAEASSHSAWEAIKRTHGFVMLCQQRM